jgi:flagellar hook-length control protein FliK
MDTDAVPGIGESDFWQVVAAGDREGTGSAAGDGEWLCGFAPALDRASSEDLSLPLPDGPMILPIAAFTSMPLVAAALPANQTIDLTADTLEMVVGVAAGGQHVRSDLTRISELTPDLPVADFARHVHPISGLVESPVVAIQAVPITVGINTAASPLSADQQLELDAPPIAATGSERQTEVLPSAVHQTLGDGEQLAPPTAQNALPAPSVSALHITGKALTGDAAKAVTQDHNRDAALQPVAVEGAVVLVNDTQLSSAENAWRQKWAGGNQAFATQDAPVGGRVLALPAMTGRAPMMEPQVPLGQGLPKRMAQVGAAQHIVQNAQDLPQLTAQSAVAQEGEVAPPALADHAVEKTLLMPMPDVQGLNDTTAQMPEVGMISVMSGPAATTQSGPSPVAQIVGPDLTPTLVEMTRSGNDGPVELALSPEELGRLTISIRQEGDFVRVSLMAERPETLDLLRRNVGDLLADLRQSGFSGASFSFGQSGQGQGGTHPDAAQTSQGDQPNRPHLLDPKHTASSQSPNGAGLDLRL